MKKVLLLFAVVSLFMSESCTRIKPGYAGFKISYSGDYRGTDSLPQETGWVWYMPGFSTVIEFPTYMQHVIYSEDGQEGEAKGQQIIIGLKGGSSFKIDVGLNYTVLPSRVAHIYFKFKTSDLDDLNNGYIRNMTRNVLNNLAGQWDMEDMLNKRPEYEKIANETLGAVLKVDGIILNQLSILKVPEATDPNLESAINAKIRAKQDADRKQTELQSSVADANKKIAEAKGDSARSVIEAEARAQSTFIEAEAKAKSNKLMESSLSDGILKKMWIEKWKGDVPTYMTGSDSKMLLQIPSR